MRRFVSIVPLDGLVVVFAGVCCVEVPRYPPALYRLTYPRCRWLMLLENFLVASAGGRNGRSIWMPSWPVLSWFSGPASGVAGEGLMRGMRAVRLLFEDERPLRPRSVV